MKVIFLDIDGVLNCKYSKTHAPSGYHGIDDILLKRVHTIIEQTGAKVVLTSTWKREIDKNLRYITSDGKYMLNKFRYKGKFSLMDKTPDAETSLQRGKEIHTWLQNHKTIAKFVILDDIEFSDMGYFNLLDNLVLTDGYIGITDEDVIKAIKILS